MNHNEEELKKINHAVGNGPGRAAIVKALQAIRPQVEAAKAHDGIQREEALISLLHEAADARRLALQTGANSYSHPGWAAAAVCESWLLELLKGTPESIESIESILIQFTNYNELPGCEVKPNTNKGWVGFALLILSSSLAFTYGGFWIGSLIFVVGLIAFGWSKRHDGPF